MADTVDLLPPSSFTSGRTAAAHQASVTARRNQVIDEIEKVNFALFSERFHDVGDITPSWANKGVSDKTITAKSLSARRTAGQGAKRGDILTETGRTVREAIGELGQLSTYLDAFPVGLPAAIQGEYQTAIATYDPGTGQKLAAAQSPVDVLSQGYQPETTPPISDDQIRNLLRVQGGGDYAGVIAQVLQAQASAGQAAFKVDPGRNPRVAAWLGSYRPENLPAGGPVGAVDAAAARRLGDNYASAARQLNYQQLTDRLYLLDQAQLNGLADQLFAAGYLQASGPNWDWGRSYSSQTLVAPDTLLAPMTTWFAETARARKGTTMSDKLEQRTKANAGEMERLRTEAEQRRNESLRYLSITADQAVRQTLGRSLGGSWNQRTVGQLADRAAKGFSISGADAEGEALLAIDRDPKLRAEREAMQTVGSIDALHDFLLKGA